MSDSYLPYYMQQGAMGGMQQQYMMMNGMVPPGQMYPQGMYPQGMYMQMPMSMGVFQPRPVRASNAVKAEKEEREVAKDMPTPAVEEDKEEDEEDEMSESPQGQMTPEEMQMFMNPMMPFYYGLPAVSGSVPMTMERMNALMDEQSKVRRKDKGAGSRVKGVWKPDEEVRFKEALEKYGDKDLDSVAEYVKTRTRKQLRWKLYWNKRMKTKESEKANAALFQALSKVVHDQSGNSVSIPVLKDGQVVQIPLEMLKQLNAQVSGGQQMVTLQMPSLAAISASSSSASCSASVSASGNGSPECPTDVKKESE